VSARESHLRRDQAEDTDMASKTKKKARPSRSKKAASRSNAVARAKPAPRTKARRVSRPAAAKRRPDEARDRAEILAVSKKWWDANRHGSIPMMVEAFVGGDKFHGFNLNGHTYYAIDEWVQLWNYLAHVMQPAAPTESGEPAMGEPHDVRLVIRGDMAFLTAESVFTVHVLPTSDAESALLPGPGSIARIPFRATEVFVREDHVGKPVWKMWHFHASPCAPEGERRMGF
jgi:hypothetical protein